MHYATESFTGIRPTNDLTIANVIGGVNPILDLESQGRGGFVLLAEYHAATTVNPWEVLEHSHELARTLIASGVTSEIYSQRQVGDLVFGTEGLIRGLTTGARLLRIPTLKEIYRDSDNPMNAGVDRIMYPMMMTADILLARPREVPTGKDQKPHLEIANDLIRSFNNRYNTSLPIPQNRLVKLPNILSLDGSGRKMSKSIPGGAVFLTDTPEAARKKIRKAVSASEPGPTLDSNVDNLLAIADGLVSPQNEEILSATHKIGMEVKDGAKRMGEIKAFVGEIVVDYLTHYQDQRESVSDIDTQNRVAMGTSKMRDLGEKTLTYMRSAFWNIDS